MNPRQKAISKNLIEITVSIKNLENSLSFIDLNKKDFQAALRKICHALLDQEHLLSEMGPQCLHCGCTEMLCGDNGPGCSSKEKE